MKRITSLALLGLVAGDSAAARTSTQALTATADEANLVTVAGKGLDNGDGRQATAAQLANPRNVDFDAAGNVYVVDFNGNVIRKVDKLTGIITTVAGNGVAGSRGDDGPATSAQLNGPGGIAFDAAGNLYISEFFGHHIRKVDTTGKITTIAGTANAGYATAEDGGPAKLARLNQPTGIAIDGAGDLYIADELNHRIRKISAGIITTVVGTGQAGYSPTEDNGPAIHARISNPADVTFDRDGNMYLTDTMNHLIRKVTAGIITTVAGTGVAGYSPLDEGGTASLARINLPRGVACDDSGTLYFGEFGGNRVRKVTAGIISTVAGTGSPGSSGDGFPATAALVASPAGIAVLAGDLYIADFSNNRVRKVAAGIMSTVAGGGPLPRVDGGPATLGQLNSPRDVVVDGAGNLYIADFNNNLVRKVDKASGTITTVAGTGVAGPALDGVAATSSPLNGPWGLGIDAAGNLYVADSNNSRIRKVAGGIITTIAGSTAGYGVRCSHDRTVSCATSAQCGVLQAGSTCSVGDDLPATAAKINVPRGLAVDAAGTVYVADVGNHRIRKISAGIITTVAGTGSPGYNLTEDGGPATLAKINRPFDVNVSISGNVYVADTSNHLIRKIDTAGTITTVAGTGTTGSSGDGGPAILAEIDAPHGVAVDSAENVYIADVNTSRVRRIRAGIIETIAGGEIGGFSGDGGPARAAQLNAPRGLDLDPSGTMYVADTGNSRVRRRNLAVQVTIGPDALNLSSNKRWIVATIDFPAGWNAAGVEVDSVRLQAIDPADGALRCSDIPRVLETTRDGDASFTRNDTDGNGTIDQLVLKYERAALDDWITADPALGLRIEGQFPGSPVATTFSGDAVIRVFQSHD